MTQREQQRAQILAQVQHGRLDAGAAAPLLGLSVRHVRRLLAALRQRGVAALAHGNRGRVPARHLTAALRSRILTLARTTYGGCNDCHFTELLAEREGVHVSRPTGQRLLRAHGLASPRRRRPPRHRRRRTPMPQAGLLVQMDGSHHPWLEDRGPRLVLHAAVDDATGRVLGGVFRPQEDAHGYFLLLRRLIRRYGVPVAAYTDRHGIFRPEPRLPLTLAEQLLGTTEATQVGRALQELGIRWIPASSPQGKGRGERLFGTFQDRLVSELRLAQARTLPDAQRILDRFLPRYNVRFARPPAQPDPAWRPAPADLERICCFKYQRTVQHDNTIQIDGHLLQLAPGPGGRSYAGARVDVHARLDGGLTVSYRGQRLRTHRLSDARARPAGRFLKPARPPRRPVTPERLPRQLHIPPLDHPWRQPLLAGPRRPPL
ncbi:MAG TPA: ISNCY family transposase [Candidatus Sulfotelmatobacter sp.]|nr:ISNCY family transposase [Candidatus Sulfotelmatobacter sp.]